MASHFADVPLWKGLALEGLANRDSLPYAEKYGMGEVGDLKNLFRGTLRYVAYGNSVAMSAELQVQGILDAARLVQEIRTFELRANQRGRKLGSVLDQLCRWCRGSAGKEGRYE